MKQNILGIGLNQELVEKEVKRIVHKKINYLDLTYSEKIFMQFILEFLKSEL